MTTRTNGAPAMSTALALQRGDSICRLPLPLHLCYSACSTRRPTPVSRFSEEARRMSRTATDTKTMKARVSAARLVARAVLTIVWAAVLVAAISVLLPAFNVPAPSVLGRVYDILTSLLAASPALAVAGGVLSLLLLIALTAIAFRTPRPALKAGVHKSDVALAAPPVAVIPAQPLVAPAPAVTLVSLPTPPSEPEPAHPPVPPVRSRKVFISHSHADNDACDRYYEALTQRGYDVWYDRRSMPPGAQLSEDIQREMRNRSAFLLMLSTASVASEWVKAETDAYRTLVFNERFRLLLPIRFEPCDAPLLLEGLKALNAYTMTFDAAIDQIVWALEAPPAANAPDTTLAAAAVPPGVVAPAGFPRALAF